MGELKPPQKVKLFFGLLFPDEEILASAEKRLANDYGDIDLKSPIVPFDKTHYYEKEMGAVLFRRFVSIQPLMDVGELPSVKIQTNAIEKLFATHQGNRRVNIDPGYLAMSKVVLATTKDYDHRLYLDQKIYGEVTLHYSSKQKSYIPWEWTYPDYREVMAIEFFNTLRKIYREQIRKGKLEIKGEK